MQIIKTPYMMSTLIGMIVSSASAQTTTYTYSGPAFPLSPSGTALVTMSFSLPTPLQKGAAQMIVSPSTWTISNGITTLSSSDPNASISVVLWPDATAAISSWENAGFNKTGFQIQSCYIPFQCSYDMTSQNSADGNSRLMSGTSTTTGSWTTHASAPPP